MWKLASRRLPRGYTSRAFRVRCPPDSVFPRGRSAGCWQCRLLSPGLGSMLGSPLVSPSRMRRANSEPARRIVSGAGPRRWLPPAYPTDWLLGFQLAPCLAFNCEWEWLEPGLNHRPEPKAWIALFRPSAPLLQRQPKGLGTINTVHTVTFIYCTSTCFADVRCRDSLVLAKDSYMRRGESESACRAARVE